jgi:hypothetical protein
MHQVFLIVLAFEIPSWASTLVIIHEIMAGTWKTSTSWAVWDVPANSFAVLYIRFKTTVALARVVIEMYASRLCMIYTLTVWPTGVALTVIHVFAPTVSRNLPICLACPAEVNHAAQKPAE